jgi:hypothetical protein
MEESMDEQQRALNRRYETIAWGAFFIWWGITTLFKFVDGTNTVGIGLILLGLNVVRYYSKIPTSSFTIVLGIIAIILGGVDMLRAILRLPFDLPAFPALLIILGLVLLWREFTRGKRSG